MLVEVRRGHAELVSLVYGVPLLLVFYGMKHSTRVEFISFTQHGPVKMELNGKAESNDSKDRQMPDPECEDS